MFTSPGRSGVGPQLALQYSSGNGNGPFGAGCRTLVEMLNDIAVVLTVSGDVAWN